jgi:hypothetical protein
MHRVVKALLDAFKEQHSLDEDIAQSFEAFVTYCVLRKYNSDAVALIGLIYDGADPGIDGVVVLLDDILISSYEELEEQPMQLRRT